MQNDINDKERSVRDLDFLFEVTRVTLSSLNVGSLLWGVVRLLRDRFGYDYVAIGLVEENKVVWRAGSDSFLEHDYNEPQGEIPIPLGYGMVGKVAATGTSRLVADVSKEPDYIVRNESTASELIVPLLRHDKVIGVLDLQSRHVDAFGKKDLHLLEVVAGLITPAVHATCQVQLERRRYRHLRLVNEVSRLVMSSLDRETVVSLACQAILDALDVTFVGILLVDPSGKVVHGGHAIRGRFIEGLDFDHLSLKSGEGLVGQVITTGDPVRVGDVRQHPGYREVILGIKSEVVVPLRAVGRVIGVLAAEHSELDFFTEEHERLLENLAGYLAQAVDNARLFESQRSRWQQLVVINETARLCTRPIDLGEILQLVARQVRDRFGYFAVGVWLCENKFAVLKACAANEDLDSLIGDKETLGGGGAGYVMVNGYTLQINSPSEFKGCQSLHPDVQSILYVPLETGGEIIGVIQAVKEEPNGFDVDDCLVLETLARSVAGAVANARLIRQTEQMRKDLGEMIVHDLRNPLQAILLTLHEFETATDQLPEYLTESVREGMSSGYDMLEMINSLLDVGRFEAGMTTIHSTPGSLNDYIRAVVRRAAPLARSKGIEVITALSSEIPVMYFDHDLVNRMLGNLVGNALKYTPAEGKVTLSNEWIGQIENNPKAILDEPYVIVRVEDTGEGVPVEHQERIFDKFGQVESRKAGLKPSTGLGLTFCRYVVEGHGGKIWVENNTKGGSVFSFVLPVGSKT